MPIWQAKFDSLFPHGAMVSQLGIPSGVTVTFLTPRLLVREDTEQPLIWCYAVDYQKDKLFRVMKLDPAGYGTWLVHTDGRSEAIFLSRNFSDEVMRRKLSRIRREWYESRSKCIDAAERPL